MFLDEVRYLLCIRPTTVCFVLASRRVARVTASDANGIDYISCSASYSVDEHYDGHFPTLNSKKRSAVRELSIYL